MNWRLGPIVFCLAAACRSPLRHALRPLLARRAHLSPLPARPQSRMVAHFIDVGQGLSASHTHSQRASVTTPLNVLTTL